MAEQAAKPRIRVKAGSRKSRVVPMASAFEAARFGARSANWTPFAGSANQITLGSINTLRNRARDAFRNNPLAASAIDKFSTHVVGRGITPHSNAKDPGFAEEAQALFRIFAVECVTGDNVDFFGHQELGARAAFSDGEYFVRERLRRPEDGLEVPLQFQIIEADYLDTTFNEILRNGGQVVGGKEYDPIGRLTHFHFWKNLPNGVLTGSTERTRIPASSVHHVQFINRPGQTRGLPKLVSALIPLLDLGEFTDATIYRQKVAAMFVAFARFDSGLQDGFNPVGEVNAVDGSAPTVRDENDKPVAAMEPGTIQNLDPGEDLTFTDPPDPGANFVEFNRWIVRLVAASLGLMYEQLTGDYDKINDRTYRAAFNEFKRRMRMYQRNIFIHQTLRRQWNAFITTAIATGKLTARDFTDRPHDYLAVEWRADAWEYLNPVQDVQADIARMRGGIKTRTMVVAETTGRDIKDLDEELLSERESAHESGLVLDSDPSQVNGSGAYQMVPDQVVVSDND